LGVNEIGLALINLPKLIVVVGICGVPADSGF
jgi:hypothetical protein